MTPSRKKPGVAFWTTVVVVVVLLYALSIGPAARLCRVAGEPDWLRLVLSVIYLPLQVVVVFGPAPVERLFLAYMRLWVDGFTTHFW